MSQITYKLKQFSNEGNLKIVKRLLDKKYSTTRSLASDIACCTGVPIFIAYYLLNNFIELTEKDWEHVQFLENFYGASVKK